MATREDFEKLNVGDWIEIKYGENDTPQYGVFQSFSEDDWGFEFQASNTTYFDEEYMKPRLIIRKVKLEVTYVD